MSTRDIEVELRGPLSDLEHTTLVEYLTIHGHFVKKQNRFLLDFSTFLEGVGERKLDVRVRVTNGKVEMVVKKGKFGGTAREEASVFPQGSLAETLKFMHLLGYEKAVACDRGIVRYEVDGIEVAIQDVRVFSKPGTIHSRFFEAEIMADESGKDAAVAQIRSFILARGLREFTEEEWNHYVGKMNTEANGIFDYTTDDIEKVAHLGSTPEDV